MTEALPMRTVVILTALRLEYEAVRSHLADPQTQWHADGTFVEVGSHQGDHATWRVALAEIGEGNQAAAALTGQLRAWLQPDALFFVGIAGGVKSDIQLGDVVVATRVHAVHGGKESADGFKSRPRSWEASHRLLQAAKFALRGPRWHGTVHFKPVAAGEVVLNSPESALAAQLDERFNDAVAIEMESAGVAQAAHLAGTLWLTIRGISDKADGQKHIADAAGSQPTAAGNAAGAAFAVLSALKPAPPGEAPQAETPQVETPQVAALPVAEPPGEAPRVEALPVQPPPVGAPPVGALPVQPPPVEAQSVEAPPGEAPPGESAHENPTGQTPVSQAQSEPTPERQASEPARTPTLPAGTSTGSNTGTTPLPPRPAESHPRPQPLTPSPRPRRRLGATLHARRRPLLISAAFLALAGITTPIVVSCQGGGSDGKGPASPAALPRCSDADTTVRIAASVDLSESLEKAASDYGNRRGAGKCTRVQVVGVNSGTAMRALADGWDESDGDKPDVWSPAGSSWLSLARSRAKGTMKELFPGQEQAKPIVQSPLTIAMPEPMAKELGWPERTISWKELADWSKDADGFWKEHNRPEWGAFKLGKTNPGYSTSGLNATVAAFFAKTGTSSELSTPHIDKPANQDFVKSIEKSAVHYGDTTLTFLANLREASEAGPDKAMSYISAVTLEENTVVAYNAGYPCGAPSDDKGCAKAGKPHTPLASFYPKDGVPFSEHPYIELNGMTAAQKAVSGDFLDHLRTPAVFKKHFAPYGYRTHEGRVLRGTGQVAEANGVLPDAPFTPMRMPEGDVLDRLLELWPTLRRRANVLTVIDTSESMNSEVPGTGDTKMELLKRAEPALFGEFDKSDRVGLWKFSDADVIGGGKDYKELVPLGPFDGKLSGGPRSKALTDNVTGLEPGGATGLYDTLDAAVKTLRDDYDPAAINAVVLLTDGVNEDSNSLSLDKLLKRIGDRGKPQIRVFTIAYGDKADEKDAGGRTVLQEVASATGGRAYDAKNPKMINDVITSVISNF
ncbi:VWA domain-containing protein [Streptomyces sp. NPDC021622]|uniref:phosphorylase family protein n=1 Tax=Streptomyces sp. NPDC021622 TaxID=3155013 RepID=UPI0033DEEDE0